MLRLIQLIAVLYHMSELMLPKQTMVIAGKASESSVGEDSLPAIRAYLHQASPPVSKMLSFSNFVIGC